jgi:hypothetical protein
MRLGLTWTVPLCCPPCCGGSRGCVAFRVGAGDQSRGEDQMVAHALTRLPLLCSTFAAG